MIPEQMTYVLRLGLAVPAARHNVSMDLFFSYEGWGLLRLKSFSVNLT